MEGNRLHHFELSDKNRTVRWVLIAILLAIAVACFVFGMLSALRTPAGWQTVTVSTGGLNCSDEFVLQYEYGASGASSTAESKALTQLYGKATETAWLLFCNEAGASDLTGIYALNQHPNEEIAVDPILYEALEVFVNSGSRALYLGPVYTLYDQIFYSDSEAFAQASDPGQSEDQRALAQRFADFAKDAEAIQLVLKGDNKVLLQISDAYLSFAQENGVYYFVDFGWLRNAFIADYFASVLTEGGFTNGFIASIDGFTRNLDQRETTYSLNLFNKAEEGVDIAAVMDYTAPKCIVSLRSYPLSALDSRRYYSFTSGRTVTSMIDPADGQSKTATDNLVSYSDGLSCAELALKLMPVYVADTFSEDALTALTAEGIHSVWFSGKQLMQTDENLKVTISDSAYTK